MKKFKAKPTQCHKCFEFGHVQQSCTNHARCYVCSGMHDLSVSCTKDRFCFNCKGSHSPNWKHCPVYKFQSDILETASNDHISLGAAKQKLRRDHKEPMSTFASAVRKSQKETTVETPPSVQETSLSGTSPKNSRSEVSNSKINATVSSFEFKAPPKHKRSRITSPQKSEIQTSNRFEALDVFGPQVVDQPLKKKKISSSCSDIDMVGKTDFSISCVSTSKGSINPTAVTDDPSIIKETTLANLDSKTPGSFDQRVPIENRNSAQLSRNQKLSQSHKSKTGKLIRTSR